MTWTHRKRLNAINCHPSDEPMCVTLALRTRDSTSPQAMRPYHRIFHLRPSIRLSLCHHKRKFSHSHSFRRTCCSYHRCHKCSCLNCHNHACSHCCCLNHSNSCNHHRNHRHRCSQSNIKNTHTRPRPRPPTQSHNNNNSNNRSHSRNRSHSHDRHRNN